MITKNIFYLLQICFDYDSIAKEKKCSKFQVIDALEKAMVSLDYYENQNKILQFKEMTFENKEAFNTYQINLYFEHLNQYEKANPMINDLIDFFLAQSSSSNELNGSEINIGNCANIFNHFFLSYQLEDKLQEKEECKKVKI